MTIKVKATAVGYHGTYRNVGDEFYIDTEEELGLWMEKVEGEESKPSANPFLDRKADDIKADIPALTDSELVEYRAAEEAGKTRKSVIEAIDAEIAARAAK